MSQLFDEPAGASREDRAPGQPPAFSSVNTFLQVKRQFLDRSVPHIKARWGVFAALFILFCIRIVLAGGYYLIAYGLGIFLLNNFIYFLSPKVDPATVWYGGDDDSYGTG